MNKSPGPPPKVEGFCFLDEMQKLPRPGAEITKEERKSRDLTFSLDRRTLDPCRELLGKADDAFKRLFNPDPPGHIVGFSCRSKKSLAKIRETVQEKELYDWFVAGMQALNAEWEDRHKEYQEVTRWR